MIDLISFKNFLFDILDEKNDFDIRFLDFAKAFDKVNHQYLINKLANYGIEGNRLNWINYFLKERRKSVVMGESVSNWHLFPAEFHKGQCLDHYYL